VLLTGIYIASLPPLGHHYSLQTYKYTPHSTSTACPGRDTHPLAGGSVEFVLELDLAWLQGLVAVEQMDSQLADYVVVDDHAN
jgi:hypothetical protein